MYFIKWVSLNKLRILVIYYLLGRNSWYGELQFLMGSSEVLGVLGWGACVENLGVPGLSGYCLCEAITSMVSWRIVDVLD